MINLLKSVLDFVKGYRTYILSVCAGEIGGYAGNAALEEIVFRSTGNHAGAAMASILGEEIGYMTGFLVPVIRKKNWGTNNFRHILRYTWEFEKANAVAALVYFPVRAYATYRMTKHGFEPGISALLPQLVGAFLIYYPLLTFFGRKAGVVKTEKEFAGAAETAGP